jgi:DNA polymerase-1
MTDLRDPRGNHWVETQGLDGTDRCTRFDWFFEEAPRTGRRLSYDIETNGLLDEVTTCHSLVLKDIDTGERWSCADGRPGYMDLEDGLDLLSEAAISFGHNIIGYDAPVLKKLFPSFQPRGIARDTLVLAKMIWPMDSLKTLDFPRWRKGLLPGQLIGAHKLEAWGYRLGLQKGEYSKTVKELSKEYAPHGDLEQIPEEYWPLATTDDKGKPMLWEWLDWCQPMQDYCEVDVEVTCKLLELITGHLEGTTKASKGIGWSPQSVKLEHDVWEHCLDQEARGYGYNLNEAIKLTGTLKTRQRELERQLKKAFGRWWQPISDQKQGERPARAYSEKQTQFKDVTLRRYSEKTGKELRPYQGPPVCTYDPDAPFVKVKMTTFNPKSRQHLGDRLQAVFGWKPTEFGGAKGDQAKVDETTIKAIPTSILPEDLRETILEYLVVSKTLGQMADGRKSWNDLCGPDGRLHGRVDPLGTVSHRGAHKDPNLGQVPSVSIKEIKDAYMKVVEKEIVWGWHGGFGAECRSLFGPGHPGWRQTGTDAAGLELRLLGHYLYPYDDGEFARRVSTPGLDIHAENAKITGLSRADTKTATYAFLYGAGGLKLGLAVGVDDSEIDALASSRAARSYVAFMRRTFRDFVMPDDYTLAHIMRGNEVKKKFLEGITGLKDLQKDIVEQGKQGFIIALDGRKLAIRKSHASLNQLLQGGGAIVCKKWMLEVDNCLHEEGLKTDIDFGQMGWIHDELQFEHRPGLEGVIAAASSEGMARTAKYYDFRGELATDSKSGSHWMDCH